MIDIFIVFCFMVDCCDIVQNENQFKCKNNVLDEEDGLGWIYYQWKYLGYIVGGFVEYF